MQPRDRPDSNALNRPDSATHAVGASAVDSLLPGFETVLKINQVVRQTVIDYVIFAAILGLIPIYGSKGADFAGFLALLLLNLKMVLDIRAHWGKPKQKGYAWIIGNGLNFLEAFAIAIIIRLGVSMIGLFIPIVVVFNAGIGHAVFTWLIGRSAHQYYFNSLSKRSVGTLVLSQIKHLRKSRPDSSDG